MSVRNYVYMRELGLNAFDFRSRLQKIDGDARC